MDNTGDFSRLMERVVQGCPEAIVELHQRYGSHIRAVIRRRLNLRLRNIFDSVDFQQDVWKSFFCGDLQRCHFNTPEELVRFLTEMANSKVLDVYRQRIRSPRRNLNREQPLDQLHYAEVAPEVAALNPSPSQCAMANEKWQQLLRGQPEPNRRILELLRLGHTHEEIATKLGLNAKKVQRFIQSLKLEGDTR